MARRSRRKSSFGKKRSGRKAGSKKAARKKKAISKKGGPKLGGGLKLGVVPEEGGKKKKKGGKKKGGKNKGLPGKPFKGIKKEQKKLSDIAGKVAKKDLDTGIGLGEKLAPDVTDGEFLDRIGDPGAERAENIQKDFDNARNLALVDDPDVQFAKDELRRRSEEGFSLLEKERLRSESIGGINQSLATGLRAARAFNQGRGISGGFSQGAFNPVLATTIRERRGLENDILLAEQQEKARALTEFSGLAERTGQNRISNLTNIGAAQSGALTQSRAQSQSIAEFNAAQKAKEIAARTARNATGLGIVQDTKEGIRQDQLLKEQLSQSQENLENLLAIA